MERLRECTVLYLGWWRRPGNESPAGCTVGRAGTPVAPSLPVLNPPLIILFDHFAVEIREGI
jgi:hypothetical protein